jgi:hypothetical protein
MSKFKFPIDFLKLKASYGIIGDQGTKPTIRMATFYDIIKLQMMSIRLQKVQL